VAIKNGAVLVKHRKNIGKGAAIKSGAMAAGNSVLVFIDGDLERFSRRTIETLAAPVIKGEVRMCKATFGREAGRVTELVAKPLLELIYPQSKLAQPLSGQFCIRKELLLSLDFPSDWGVDMSIVLSAMKHGELIAEADIGELSHKHRDLPSLAKTARDVTRTILQSAGFLAKNHSVVIFDFDGTLTKESSITRIFGSLGLGKRLTALREMYFAGKIFERQLTELIARELKGRNASDYRKAASKVRLAPHAKETLEYLRRTGYKIVVVSFAYLETILSVFPPECFDLIVSPRLHAKNGIFTWKVSIPRFKSNLQVFSKGAAVRRVLRALRAKPQEAVAVGNAKSDEEMFAEVGISVSINQEKGVIASRKIRSLPELLVIVG